MGPLTDSPKYLLKSRPVKGDRNLCVIGVTDVKVSRPTSGLTPESGTPSVVSIPFLILNLRRGGFTPFRLSAYRTFSGRRNLP